MENIAHPLPPSQKPWYKTAAGTVFLSILGIILGLTSIFALMVVYYSWQINYGDAQKLKQEFNLQFTASNLLSGKAVSITAKDIKSVIRSHNHIFGNPDSDLTIVAFLDVGCAYSRAVWPVFKEIIENYEPVTKVVFKNLALNVTDPSVGTAVICAEEQDKFLDYYTILFSEKDFSKNALIRYANQIDMNTDVFAACLEDERHTQQLAQDFEDASRLGLRGTPTFIVNDKKIEGVLNKKEWDKIILDELKK